MAQTPPHAMGSRLTTPEAAKAVGITTRQLRHWVHQGHLKPTVLGEGSGEYWEWEPDDLEAARRIKCRMDWGLTLEAAARKEDPPLTRLFGRVTFDYW